jgi:hypothetical protein
MSAEVQRLLQAVELFSARSRGAELPKGVEEAVSGLKEALGQPMPPSADTPGSRAAAKAAPGTTGTGEHFSKAAKGLDSPSPGQRAAKGERNTDIEQAAAQILAAAQSS